MATHDRATHDRATPDFSELDRHIQEVLDLCTLLRTENRSLKARQRTWVTERADLVEKNELAKTELDAMIQRLKSLEQDA